MCSDAACQALQSFIVHAVMGPHSVSLTLHPPVVMGRESAPPLGLKCGRASHGVYVTCEQW